MRPKPYLIVAEMPACSAVLHVRGKEITIHTEGTAEQCKWYAIGFCMGSNRVRHGGYIKLPAGNPAISYRNHEDFPKVFAA